MIHKWFSNLFKKSEKSYNFGPFTTDGSFRRENINELYKKDFTTKEVYEFFKKNDPVTCRKTLFGVSQDKMARRPDISFAQPTISKFEKDCTSVGFDVCKFFYVFYKWEIDNKDF